MSRNVAGPWSLFIVGLVVVGCSKPRMEWVKAGTTDVVPATLTQAGATGSFSESAPQIGVLDGALRVGVRLKPGMKPYQYGVKEGPSVVRAEARVEPDGAWSVIDMRADGQDPTKASFTIPRQYPIGAAVRVRLVPSGGSSEVVLRDLPPVKEAFDLRRPEIAHYEGLGVALDAAAYRPKPFHPGVMPIVGVVVRARPTRQGDRVWRLANLSIRRPFVPSEAATRSFGSVTPIAFYRETFYECEEESTPFADAMPRVQLTADLEQYEPVVETVDFGKVPRKTGNRRMFILPTRPIERKLPSGIVLRLLPTRADFRGSTVPDVTSLRLAVVDRERILGEEEKLYLSVSGAPYRINELWAAEDGADVDLYETPPPGRLRLHVMRIRRIASSPVVLDLDAREVPFKAMSSSVSGECSAYVTADSSRRKLLPVR